MTLKYCLLTFKSQHPGNSFPRDSLCFGAIPLSIDLLRFLFTRGRINSLVIFDIFMPWKVASHVITYILYSFVTVAYVLESTEETYNIFYTLF